MEAHGVREHPDGTLRGRFVRHALAAAVTDVILPAFAARAPRRGGRRDATDARHGRPRDRVPAGAHPLRHRRPGRPGRPAGSVARRSSATGICTVWRSCSQGSCGSRTASSTRSTTPRTSTARSSDRPTQRHPSLATRPAAATRGPAGASAGPPRARSAKRSSRRSKAHARDSSSSSTPTSTCSRSSPTRRPTPGEARPVRRGAGRACRPGGCPIAASTDPRSADEIQHARRYANRLRQALTHGTRQIDKRTPGGRFDSRAYTRGQAQRHTGRPTTTHPWRITRHITAPIQEPHVGLVIDTSGSMAAYEYALGPICWILTDGLRQIGGRVATALFGNSVTLLADGTGRCRSSRGSGPAAAPRSPATRSNCSATSSR